MEKAGHTILNHPVAQLKVPAFLRIGKIVIQALKKARNNSIVNRMADEDKTGWESPWHRAPQQLCASRKTLACPLQLHKRLGTS